MYDPTIERHAKVKINELELHVSTFKNVSHIPSLLCFKLFSGSLFYSNETKSSQWTTSPSMAGTPTTPILFLTLPGALSMATPFTSIKSWLRHHLHPEALLSHSVYRSLSQVPFPLMLLSPPALLCFSFLSSKISFQMINDIQYTSHVLNVYLLSSPARIKVSEGQRLYHLCLLIYPEHQE